MTAFICLTNSYLICKYNEWRELGTAVARLALLSSLESLFFRFHLFVELCIRDYRFPFEIVSESFLQRELNLFIIW